MEMKHGLQLQQRQQLIMTPRLQQALKILQMPMLELQQMLKQEVLVNPLLEEVDEVLENEEIEEVREEQLSPDEKEPAEDKEPDWAEFYDDSDNAFARRESEQTEYFEKVPTTEVSFQEHLASQLRLVATTAREIEIGEYLIGSLDDRGFLTIALDEVVGANERGWTLEEVERVLGMIQSFDPPGVGARDHRECMLIQLTQREEEDTLAYQIVRDHYDDMLKNRHHEIARAVSVTDEEVQVAKDQLAMLNLNPGGEISGEDAKYVFPDLVVDRVSGKYEVYLNDRNVPRLRVSPAYESVLRGKEKGGDGTREYIEGKLNSARWLIQTIEQRRKTMIKVMKCIVEVQKEFFEKGLSHLKPLTLSQIAERIGMHESTVSRVTRGKYVQTPRGVFELKYFFSAAITRTDGDDISAKTAKDIIEQLIQEEDKRSPLSDQKIADILGDRGLKIARRTVAKYREQLSIPTARYRKRY